MKDIIAINNTVFGILSSPKKLKHHRETVKVSKITMKFVMTIVQIVLSLNELRIDPEC